MMLPSLLPLFGRRRHRPCGACTPVFIWSTRRRPRVEAGGSQVDGLLHDDGDEAIVVIPCHTSSVAASLFVAHHPRHHHPCCPRPLLHHCCRHSPITLVTVFLSLAALFISAFIIGHTLKLFVTTHCRARTIASLQHSRCWLIVVFSPPLSPPPSSLSLRLRHNHRRHCRSCCRH